MMMIMLSSWPVHITLVMKRARLVLGLAVATNLVSFLQRAATLTLQALY